ncbi:MULTISPECIES: ABC transporter substrate-binding protein [unclassified Oceanispirochaeta]|uniref:ABC transporter substrate-binding protein n=1 Tax=unclassified Oceanispirochaeta TaxID=2635722 RepID=UPI000E08D4A9|nr:MULTISPECIES: ABC transporter substrate-binding protein [unclassified Oceanispirochaeta]MBF9014386.1 ABC transporter substrate-binding protein [Oceanispirochaeta sp. M2]NPD71272.1 ABC transporter substrate-binding protein [Oceanispirochaeta sp. M1]RDG33655.1 ABC transporter substrate-binding protein [Oceanispirochaeta sp. M1]
MKTYRFSTLLCTIFISGFLLFALASCSREEEMTLEEAQALKVENQAGILAGTIKKPGGTDIYAIGKSGGIWNSSLTGDPKTFNLIIADSDGDSSAVINTLLPGGLVQYDPYIKEWKSGCADFEITVFEDEDRMDVLFTLRDDLYWSFFDSDEKIKITADDLIFWYDEIYGNSDLQMTAYSGQFMTMSDGTDVRIEMEKLDDMTVVFHYPRIVANPLLTSNMTFGPRFIYEPALREGGVQGVKEILSIDTDVKTLPSAGAYFLTEYTPGVRLVYERNNDHWDKDKEGNPLPYFEKSINKIVPNMNTNYLLFKNGERDGYAVRAEDLDDLINTENKDYSIYDGGATMGSNFICFNQNPSGLEEPVLSWFTQKEFRQAMSRLTNRDRMVKQIYRGLATPALHHYAIANPYYDESISNVYTYNPEEALKLLESIGIKQDEKGTMRDTEGRAIEFDIITNSDNNIRMDAASIFADECGKVGIKVNLTPLDFQKMIEMLTATYDWHVILISLGSGNYWPTGGSNVWSSDGNLHLWNPLQKEPATDWEARVDYLYNEGSFTPDPVAAKEIWDEFQSILLEELPLYYLVHQNSFYAIRDKWDNVFYDNLGGLDTNRLFLKDSE